MCCTVLSSAAAVPACQSTLFLASDYQEGCPGGAGWGLQDKQHKAVGNQVLAVVLQFAFVAALSSAGCL